MKNILRPAQAAKALAISRSTFWRLQQSSDFPRKIQISSKAVGFYEEDILAWLEKRSSDPTKVTALEKGAC